MSAMDGFSRHTPAVRRIGLGARVARGLARAVCCSVLATLAFAAPAAAKARGKQAPPPVAARPAPVVSTPLVESSAPVEVRVERVKPARPKLETLRFLKDNRDFIRARYDRLRVRTLAQSAVLGEIDPRFLQYRDLRAEVAGAADSLALLRAARERQTLLTSVSDLGALEVRLDRLERLLAQQSTRLGVLESGFTGDQRTELIVVVEGTPTNATAERIDLVLEQGETISAKLTDEQRAALARGGVLEIFHGLIEPREQLIEMSIDGLGLPGESGFLTLAPERDRLTFLKLDLTPLGNGQGAASIRASTWRNDGPVAEGR
jgi:hypothetical protein